jgi:hypothetical protein
MGELVAMVQEDNDALQRQVCAVAEVDSLEATPRVVGGNFLPMFTNDSMSGPLGMC